MATPSINAGIGTTSTAQENFDKATAEATATSKRLNAASDKRATQLEEQNQAYSTRQAAKKASKENEEAEAEAAKSIKGLAIGAAAATLSVHQFAATLREIAELQKSGSEKTGDMRVRMGQAGRDLKMSDAQIESIIAQQESGEKLPGGLSRSQDVSFFETAAATARRTGIPAQLNALMRVRNADINPSLKQEAAGMIVPEATVAIAGTNGRRLTGTAQEAQNTTGEIEASREQGNANNYATGANKRRASQTYEAALQSGNMFAVGAELLTFKGMGGRQVAEVGMEMAYGASNPDPKSNSGLGMFSAMIKVMTKVAGNTTPPPPSTIQGQ